MKFLKRQGAASRAMAHSVQGVGYFIIALVVLYTDVMTAKLLWSHFPTGFWQYLAVGGIFATGMTVIALVVGKSHWFRPGGQLNWAWACTGIELAVSVTNLIAAFNPEAMAWWVFLMPATPFAAVLTWILMIFFDPARAQQHAQMEMEDEKSQAELNYARAEHEAHMTVKHEFLGAYSGFLLEEARAPHNLEKLREGARRMSQQVISGIIGSPIGMAPSNIVDSTLAQSSLPPAVQNGTSVPTQEQPSPLAQPAALSQNGHVSPPEKEKSTEFFQGG